MIFLDAKATLELVGHGQSVSESLCLAVCLQNYGIISASLDKHLNFENPIATIGHSGVVEL